MVTDINISSVKYFMYGWEEPPGIFSPTGQALISLPDIAIHTTAEVRCFVVWNSDPSVAKQNIHLTVMQQMSVEYYFNVIKLQVTTACVNSEGKEKISESKCLKFPFF